MSDQASNNSFNTRPLAQIGAHQLGVDEALISDLVDSFYRKIDRDEVLGPIFARAVDGNWDPHLEKMKNFWSSVTLYTGKYQGKPMPIHQQIEGLQLVHFDRWLSMFRETLNDVVPSAEVVEFFMLRAEQIARSLKAGVFLEERDE